MEEEKEREREKEKKIAIAKQIKDISLQQVEEEFKKLQDIGYHADEVSERSRIGNNVVDYFSFPQRLETRGKYNVNYFEFVSNIEMFKKKKFIENMLLYYKNVKNKNNKKNIYIVYKEVYNICISAINIIRPLVYMEIYARYQPNRILDFCAGWGGGAVGASAMNIPSYIGIELNHDLKEPYHQLCSFLQTTSSTTQVQMLFQNALDVDFSLFDYDFVFTSPPYYFIQKYKNNTEYTSKKEMDEHFYKPLFSKTFLSLKKGGVYCINVNKEVYENVLVDLLGPAHETFPYRKSKRQNNYQEIVYAWRK